MSLIDEARERQAARPEPRRIDYDRMNREHPKQKAALTRAVNRWKDAIDNLDYYGRFENPAAKAAAENIARVCKAAIEAWNACGAWPDDWHTWNIALRDAANLELDDL